MFIIVATLSKDLKKTYLQFMKKIQFFVEDQLTLPINSFKTKHRKFWWPSLWIISRVYFLVTSDSHSVLKIFFKSILKITKFFLKRTLKYIIHLKVTCPVARLGGHCAMSSLLEITNTKNQRQIQSEDLSIF